mgnify:FL=1
MTSRERVLAIARREKPDRIPKDLSWGLCPAKAEEFRRRTGAADYWDYFDLDYRSLEFAPTRIARDAKEHFAGRDEEPGFTVDEWGVGLGHSTDPSLHFEHLISPLVDGMTEEQAASYPLPDFLEGYRHAHFKETVGGWHERGLAVCGALAQTIFEKSWAIRGFQETLMDMMAEPEPLMILFDRIADLRIEQSKLMIRAGVDILMLGDDVGMQSGMLMRRSLWQQLLKPRLARVIQAARELRSDIPVFYHSCGNPGEIIPDLIEVGVTILNPVQPECLDHQAIKREYGDRLAFWGGVSAQRNLSFGTPAQVREEVKRCIDTLGEGGGYLIGPNHMVEPEVPWENLLAYFEAVELYGKYD